ncbi:MAG TPA: hypothetical protein VF984_00145 [Actinomycetota bacterium]
MEEAEPVEDASEALLSALDAWESAVELATPDEAVGTFDDASLQVFWQRWPHVSTWGGAVWRRLNEDLADAATPLEESEDHDVGGEGG